MSMPTRTNKQWILTKRPSPGVVLDDLFELKESPLANLQDGDFLVQNRFLSFDPTQRMWMERDTYIPAIPLGNVMASLATGVVLESRNPQFGVGTRVSGLLGWQEYSVTNGKGPFPLMPIPEKVPDEAALSVFGMTGLTAYFGMEDVAKPQPGDVVVVSGAAGATGSIAAQIARIKGAKVIGIAGGESKCRWLLEKAKLHHAIDYKAGDIRGQLREFAPKGINAYFDNVGGTILDDVLSNLAMGARIALCGGIQGYSGQEDASIKNYMNLVITRSRMQGFLISDYATRYQEAALALAAWVASGQIHYEVDVQKGIENAPRTLQRLFDGKNLGKQVLML